MNLLSLYVSAQQRYPIRPLTKTVRSMSNSSLVPERQLVFSPGLAATIGLEESILLQHLQALFEHRHAQERDNYAWLSVERDFLLTTLPFWNAVDLHRITRSLVDKGVMLMESPPLHSSEKLVFALNEPVRANQATPVNVMPMAALTKGRNGREMSEIGFLIDAGAIAFTDCDHVVSNPKVFARALSYACALGALVIAHPQEPTLSKGAAATSGKFASLRGLPAVSAIAERMGLDRDIALLEMTGAKYHADQITTARALPALQRAKNNGLDITAGTSIHHLTLNELDVADYRTFFKVKPPLRSEEDRHAIIEALQSGLIDTISSMHTPQDEESKRLPFEEAASGAVGLETLLPAALRLFHSGEMDLPGLFRALALNPAKRLGLPCGRATIGAPADLVLFDANQPFVLDRATLKSKSKNTPFDGARLQGRILASFVAGKQVFGQ